jgi:hypothetical protein
MSEDESLCDSICEEQARLTERELASFISAVTELHGLGQARLSEKDWLEEAELMDTQVPINVQRLRAVTIAASARLASRVPVAIESANSG